MLVDTFVVRPLLVPAVMAVLGRANYWPRKMPAPTLGPLSLGAEPSRAREPARRADDDDADADAGAV